MDGEERSPFDVRIKIQAMSDLVQAYKDWKGFVAVRVDMGPLRPKFTKPVCAEWRFRALVDEYL